MSPAGFTFIELLLAVAIIALLAALLVPSLTLVREQARRNQCAANQRQIFAAMQAYGAENAGFYPVCPDADGWRVGSAEGMAQSSLEWVCAYARLPAKVARCPSRPSAGPHAEPSASLTAETGWQHSSWRHGTGDTMVAYAYDWSVPPVHTGARTMLADRGMASHRVGAMMTLGDGHSVWTPRAPSHPMASETVVVGGWPDGGAIINALVTAAGVPDNVFAGSDPTDGGQNAPDIGSAGRGSAHGSFLK